MNKQNRPFLENKTFGHIIAFMLLLMLGYGFFYVASEKMQYTWHWNSVVKYFFYEKTEKAEAPYSGSIVIDDLNIMIKSQSGSIDFSLPKSEYKTTFYTDDYVYEAELVATKVTWEKGPITNGFIVTLQISVLSIILAFTIGIILATMRLSRFQFIKDIATVYITVIRGTPLIVQISLFYFIIASPIFKMDSFYSGTLSLGMFFGAYIAEVLRGAIQSIDKGQGEAAKSLGMNGYQTMVFVVVPQSLKRALPTLINEVISLVKDSSLVSAISVTELTKTGRDIQSSTFASFEAWIVIAGIYLLVTSVLSIIGNKIEARMKKQGGM